MKFNVVFANGIFASFAEDGPELMPRMIKAMFDLCDEALAFTTLSAWAPDKTDGEFYADPLATYSFCASLTPWLTLRHDYHPRDFTIYMYKEKND